jgi:hypothetical protein
LGLAEEKVAERTWETQALEMLCSMSERRWIRKSTVKMIACNDDRMANAPVMLTRKTQTVRNTVHHSIKSGQTRARHARSSPTHAHAAASLSERHTAT